MDMIAKMQAGRDTSGAWHKTTMSKPHRMRMKRQTVVDYQTLMSSNVR